MDKFEMDSASNLDWLSEDASDLGGTELSSLSVKEWTSEDYSRIFIKYRPRLAAYAQKFLSDPASVDEVVQDAFLYLFMSLPELDSELGVLKYLKWKTRFLALDVLRAQGKRPALFAVAEEAEELMEPADGPDAFFSGVDDAAIVNLALSRIPDRHREVLIRSVLDDASAREIGEGLGITENATRQLLHRARASFREQVALVASENNTTVSAFLSTAVRKAKEAGVKGAALILLLAVPALGLGLIYRGIGVNPSTDVVVVAPQNTAAPIRPTESPDESQIEVVIPVDESVKQPAEISPIQVDPVLDDVDAPSPVETAEDVSAFSLTRETSIEAYAASPMVSTGEIPEFATYVIKGASGVEAEVNIHYYSARLDVAALLTFTSGGQKYSLDTEASNVVRSLVNKDRSLKLSFELYPDASQLPVEIQADVPSVLVIEMVLKLDFSQLTSVEMSYFRGEEA
jgi:RNA polymerase sigma-70 factor (ECF subfamily)